MTDLITGVKEPEDTVRLKVRTRRREKVRGTNDDKTVPQVSNEDWLVAIIQVIIGGVGKVQVVTTQKVILKTTTQIEVSMMQDKKDSVWGFMFVKHFQIEEVSTAMIPVFYVRMNVHNRFFLNYIKITILYWNLTGFVTNVWMSLKSRNKSFTTT